LIYPLIIPEDPQDYTRRKDKAKCPLWEPEEHLLDNAAVSDASPCRFVTLTRYRSLRLVMLLETKSEPMHKPKASRLLRRTSTSLRLILVLIDFRHCRKEWLIIRSSTDMLAFCPSFRSFVL